MNTIQIEPASFFAALADPTRLHLVELLALQPAGRALCVNALAHRLGISQPAVSQHLQVLRGVGLVYSERRGARVHYFLDRGRLSLGQSYLRALAQTVTREGASDPREDETPSAPGDDAISCT